MFEDKNQGAAPSQVAQTEPVYQVEIHRDNKHWADIDAKDVAGWEASRFTVRKLYAAPVAPSQTDPLDTPLPCDIKVGAVTIRKGCALHTLVVRMESLQRMAMKAFPEPSAEGRALIDSMIAGTWKPDEGGQASAQSEGSQA